MALHDLDIRICILVKIPEAYEKTAFGPVPRLRRPEMRLQTKPAFVCVRLFCISNYH